MKQTIFTFLHFIIFTFFMAACNNDNDVAVFNAEKATIKFSISGDFTFNGQSSMVNGQSRITRALTADGKDMTDVWILDYIGSELQQTIHQSASDADFGAPTLDLSMGLHHLYFIASRGTGATLNTDAKTITFSKVLDTFWRDYEINITAGTSSGSSRNVSLDRIVTKLKVTFSDAIPTGAATFNVTPQTWYYGFNYTTGNPITATSNQTVVVNIPDTEYGKTNVFLSVFGFSSTTEWTTDIALNCKTSDNTILGQATILSAPFVRNRASEYTGLLFTDNGGWSLSLNTDWSTSHTGSW